MSTFVVSLMFSAGVGAWLYAKLSHRGGEGNNAQAAIVAAMLASILFLVTYLTLRYFVGW